MTLDKPDHKSVLLELMDQVPFKTVASARKIVEIADALESATVKPDDKKAT